MRRWTRQHGVRAMALLLGCAALGYAPRARAMEHVTLSNGFEFDCVRREPQGDKVRLYFPPSNGGVNSAGAGTANAGAESNYLDVAAAAVVRVETLPDPPAAVKRGALATAAGMLQPAFVLQPALVLQPTLAEMTQMLARAGAQHNIDSDLLASVVHAESGGRVRAVSRTGARGLMQLMPGTAAALGVHDAFVADQNVEGGTRYLDELLTRYHDNIALALAAYNAGPGAVDRFHGIPPFRETQMYVARVIREFNRRKTTPMAKGQ